jgi:hypothetical protein
VVAEHRSHLGVQWITTQFTKERNGDEERFLEG